MANKKSTSSKKVSTSQQNASDQLPTIKEHITQSWEMMVGSVKNLILLWLLTVLAVAIVGALLAAASVGALASAGGFAALQDPTAFIELLTSPAAGMLVFLTVMAMIAYSIFTAAVSAAMIIALANHKKQPSFSSIFQKGLKLALPLFLLGLIAGLLSFGGTILFIIPGIVIAILFSFSVFEKVLHNKTIMDSLKGSYALVKDNFGIIFVRWLVVVGFYLVIYALLPEIFNAISESLGALYGMITGLAGLLLNWLVMAYFLILYQKIRQQTKMTHLPNISWIWLVAGIGWLIVILGGVTLANRIPQWMDMMEESANQEINDDYNNYQQMMDDSEADGEFNLDVDVDTSDLSPEQQEAMKDAQAAMEAYLQQLQEADEAAQ